MVIKMKKNKFVENDVVRNIEYYLSYYNRYYVNVHGSEYSANGTPDIITFDKDNKFLAIEAKVSGRQPKVDQMSHCLQIIRSGGRFVVAYEDFDLTKIDDESVQILEVEDNKDLNKVSLAKHEFRGTTEVKLK